MLQRLKPLILQGLRLASDHIPRHAGASIARGLVTRANAARDAGDYPLAARLYQEALRLAPSRARLHIQCAHMLKEAGDIHGAQHHYERAAGMLPDDADLALQLGHFHKIALNPDRAAAEYRRALQLRPGWAEATDELARVRDFLHDDEVAGAADTDIDWIVPELLPRPARPTELHAGRISILRLAPKRVRSPQGTARVLQGIEAVRGFCVFDDRLDDVRLLLDGAEVARMPLVAHAIAHQPDLHKYVFNLWHDFRGVVPGSYRLELRLTGPAKSPPVWREQVLVLAPDAGTPADSDGVVDLPPGDPRELAERIATLPSRVRPAARTVLPRDIRTILVQRADQLGDLVCSLPAIRRLRELFPNARLVGLLSRSNVDLARSLGLFDDIVIAGFVEREQEGRRTITIEDQRTLREALAPFGFDIAVDLAEAADSRPLLLLSGAKFLYGFMQHDWAWLSAGFNLAARDPVNRLETAPASAKILAMIESLGALRGEAWQPARNMDAPRATLSGFGIGAETRYVVLHTGARLAFSRWPGFAALTTLLLARTELTIIVMRDDATDVVPPASDRLHVVTGQLPFATFDALLTHCDAFVGNDSGTKHLAALRGAPVISLHMARLNWSEWGQEGEGFIMSRRVPCAGCGIHSLPEECGRDFACIRDIGVEEVFAALIRVIEGGTSRNRAGATASA